MEPQSRRQEIESLVQAEWKKLRDKLPRPASPQESASWEYQLTPAIPAAWPPDGKGIVYYYAFAYGTRMDLRDAQPVAAPWARITSGGQSAPRLEILKKEIKQIGIEGVRPLRQEEIKIFDQRATVDGEIRNLASKTSLAGIDPKRVRQFFQFWCSTHGVIAEQLRPRHPQFFAWVGCKQR
jgi:hypothetical protein